MDKSTIIEKIRSDYERLNSLKKLEFETGVSKTYLSQVLNGKHDPGKSTWTKLENHYKRLSEAKVWQIVNTGNMKKCEKLFKAAARLKSFHVVIGDAGTGKSTAASEYARSIENAFLVNCEDFTQKRFVEAICRAMYIRPEGTKFEMMQAIRDKMRETPNALLILDEASMLNDNCLTLLKPLWGDWNTSCFGLVLFGVPYLEINLVKKARKDKKGFVELYDRINKPIIRMEAPKETEISAICYANGIQEDEKIDYAVEQCQEHGSLRTIENLVLIDRL